jgi:hypothetical protein
MDVPFDDAVRILSTPADEAVSVRGSDGVDGLVLGSPSLRIDAWLSLFRHSSSTTVPKYARKVVAALGDALSRIAPLLARKGNDEDVTLHLRRWLWAVAAFVSSATNTSAAEGTAAARDASGGTVMLAGMGSSMFGRVEEVLLVVVPALRAYAEASPTTLASFRSNSDSDGAQGLGGCPLVATVVTCCELLARAATLPSNHRKLFDACFGSGRGGAAASSQRCELLQALCSARASAIADLSSVPPVTGGAVASQIAKLLQLTESIAGRQLPFECGSIVDISGAFCSSAMLIDAATASRAAGRATSCSIVEAEHSGLLLRSGLPEWCPPHPQTRERVIFEAIFYLVNVKSLVGGRAGVGSDSVLRALPLFLERYILLHREPGTIYANRASQLRGVASALPTAAPSVTATQTSALVLRSPAFVFFCEMLAAALGAHVNREVGLAQGVVPSGAGIVLLQREDLVSTSLRLRVTASLLAVVLQYGLYSAHEDIAPHPQIAVLEAIANVALLALLRVSSPDAVHAERSVITKAVLGLFTVLLQLDHRVVQPHIGRVLSAAVEHWPAQSAADAASVYSAASVFAAALCSVFSRLRSLPVLLSIYWAAATAQLIDNVAAAQAFLPFRAVYLSQVHADAVVQAISTIPSGQSQEIGDMLQQHLQAASDFCNNAVTYAAESSAASGITAFVKNSGKKRRRDADSLESRRDIDSCVALYSAVAFYAAAFLRHAHVSTGSAVPLLSIALAFYEKGSAPMLSLCKRISVGGAGSAPLSGSFCDAAAAAVHLAVACSSLALECAPHGPVRDLVPSVVEATAADAELSGALEICWPLSCYRARLLDGKSQGGSRSTLDVILLQDAMSWWPATEPGASEMSAPETGLVASLSQLAASRLPPLHALLEFVRQRDATGETQDAARSKLHHCAVSVSDLLILRSEPSAFLSAVDIALLYVTPAVRAGFVSRLCNVPAAATPGTWQHALWHDAELYELKAVSKLLPRALTDVVRASLERLCSSGAINALKPTSTSKKKKSSAVFEAVNVFLAAESSALQIQALHAIADVIPQSPAAEQHRAALDQSRAVLSFIAKVPATALAMDSSHAGGSLRLHFGALRSTCIAMGCAAEELPPPRGPLALTSDIMAGTLPILVRQAVASCGAGGDYVALHAGMGELLANEISEALSAVSLASLTGSGEGRERSGGKRKSLKGPLSSTAQLEAVTNTLMSALHRLLVDCGLPASSPEWVWPSLVVCVKSLQQISSLTKLQRNIAASAIATVASRLSLASGPTGVLHSVKLAAAIGELHPELLEDGSPVSLLQAAASSSLREAARAAASESGDNEAALGIVQCLACLLRAPVASVPGASANAFVKQLVGSEVLALFMRITPACDSDSDGSSSRNLTAAGVANILMLAPLVDASALMLQAVRSLDSICSDASVLGQRCAVAVLSACAAAVAQGYYHSGGPNATFVGAPPPPPVVSVDTSLGSGSREARDLISAAVRSALPAMARLALESRGASSSDSPATLLASRLHLDILTALRLFLSHPRVVFLTLAHVKVCLEAISGYLRDTDGVIGATNFVILSGAGPLRASQSTAAEVALDDADAFSRLDGATPLLTNAAAVASAAAAHAQEQRRSGKWTVSSTVSTDSALQSKASSAFPPSQLTLVDAALVAVCGVLQAAFKYHRSAALALMPLASQILQVALVNATAPRASEYGDEFPANPVLTATLRACEEAARMIKVARFHAVPLVACLLVQWARERDAVPQRVRERLLPALHALFDVCTLKELQMLHSALGSPHLAVARAQLKELHAAFVAHAKYKGKL